jgi:tetratricopeptide (TPR) repeat protein
LIRETLLKSINPVRARHLHLLAAQEFERSSLSQEQAAVLAHHYEMAGQPEQAFDYWTQAVIHARQLASDADARWIFNRAEKLIAHSAKLAEEQIFILFQEWTEMAYETEDVVTIQRINTDLLHLGRKRNSPLLIGAALDGLSNACMASDQFEDGLAYTEQALKTLETSPHRYLRMQAYNHRGVFFYMLNRLDESIQSLQDALSLGIGVLDSQEMQAHANAHYQLSFVRVLNGWPEPALSHAIRALSESQQTHFIHGQISAYSSQALANYFLGNYSAAREASLAGIDLSQRTTITGR